MVEYKETLNLPQTTLEMRANATRKEPETQKFWEGIKVYEKNLAQRDKSNSFVLHDGPPYLSSEKIHVGTALNKILKDILIKYKSMSGFYSPYVPGYDGHGLPIENAVVKNIKGGREALTPAELRAKCRDFAHKNLKGQESEFKRLGVWGDWEHPYLTINPEFEAEQVRVFGEMYKKGYIYKGLKPVYWCTDCETALAEAEIEYQDCDTMSIYVKFPVQDGKGVLDNDTFIVIWTTTPWTLPGNTGITVGGEYEYSVVDTGKEKLVMATSLVDEVMSLAGITEYKTIKTVNGTELEGILCKHPFLDRTSKVVLGSDDTVAVELDTGTGAVHTAPSYGKEDYLCGIKNGLDIIVTVDGKGYQTEGAGPFAGMFYAKSNDAIIDWLDKNGYLLRKEKINHSYPHCWRCKNPIIFRATDQWFASVNDFKKETLDAIKTVKWTPTWGEERIASMVKD